MVSVTLSCYQTGGQNVEEQLQYSPRDRHRREWNRNGKKDSSAGEDVPIPGRNHQPFVQPDVSGWPYPTSSDSSDSAKARGMLSGRGEHTNAFRKDAGRWEVYFSEALAYSSRPGSISRALAESLASEEVVSSQPETSGRTKRLWLRPGIGTYSPVGLYFSLFLFRFPAPLNCW